MTRQELLDAMGRAKRTFGNVQLHDVRRSRRTVQVARLGGYLARRCDGPPGWRSIWKGWLSLQALLEGVHLAPHLLL
jgi:hypothetical protein